MLNMQSADAGNMATGIAPSMAVQDPMGNGTKGEDMVNSKTNSETITVVDTNHEGVIVSNSKDSFIILGYLI